MLLLLYIHLKIGLKNTLFPFSLDIGVSWQQCKASNLSDCNVTFMHHQHVAMLPVSIIYRKWQKLLLCLPVSPALSEEQTQLGRMSGDVTRALQTALFIADAAKPSISRRGRLSETGFDAGRGHPRLTLGAAARNQTWKRKTSEERPLYRVHPCVLSLDTGAPFTIRFSTWLSAYSGTGWR